jgi:hypothetical protein
VQNHVQLVGILWLVLSALTAVGGVALLTLGNVVFAHLREMGGPSDVPTGFLTALFTTLGILLLAKAVIGFLGGWGLLRRESWGRIVALVLAFLGLLNFPLGTALGVYTLWVLLPGASQREYDALVAARAGGPRAPSP